MSKIELLPGERFGKLVVVEEVKQVRNEKGRLVSRMYLCKCDCGNDKIVSPYKLLNGEIKSCGCGKRRAPIGSWKRKRNVPRCPYPTSSCRDSRVGRCCRECPLFDDCPDACLNNPASCGRNDWVVKK